MRGWDGKQQQTHTFFSRPISLHSHVILAKIQKTRKSREKVPFPPPPTLPLFIRTYLGLEKKRGKFSSHNFLLVHLRRVFTTSSLTPPASDRKPPGKIENENHLLRHPPPHLLNNIVFLLLKQFIIARWLVDSQTHTHEDGNLL